MKVKILKSGKDEFNRLEVTCVSNPISNPNNRKVHFVVIDTTKWHWQAGYERKYQRKMNKDNCFAFNNNLYDLTNVL